MRVFILHNLIKLDFTDNVKDNDYENFKCDN